MQTIISPQKFLRFADRLDGPPRPPHYDVDLSGYCSHHCPGCFFCDLDEHNRDSSLDFIERPGMAKENRAYLRHDRVLKLIDEIKENGGRAITFVGGGEPTQYPKVAEVLRKVVSAGLKFGVISHFGLPYKDDFIEAMTQATWLRVSLNAATAHTYAAVQGTKATEFLAVMKNVQRLVHARGVRELPRIGISFLIGSENFNEIERAAILAKNLGADFIQYKPLITVKKTALFAGMEQVIDAGLALARGHASRRFQVLDQFRSRLEELDEHWTKKAFAGTCWVPRMNLKVCATGITNGCCEFGYTETFVLGDIYKDSLRTILDRIPEAMKQIDMKGCPACFDKRFNRAINEGKYAGQAPPPESPDQDFV